MQVLTDLHFLVDHYLIKQNVSTCSLYETIATKVSGRNLMIPGVQPGNTYYVEITPYFETLGNSCSSNFFIQGCKINPCHGCIVFLNNSYYYSFCIHFIRNTVKAKGLC